MTPHFSCLMDQNSRERSQKTHAAKRYMPRTTKNSKAKDGCGLGQCWSEREIKAVLKAAKDAEKKEAKRVEEAIRESEAKEKEAEDLAREVVAFAIEGAILQVTAEEDEMGTEEKAEAMAEDVAVNLGVDSGVDGLDALVQGEDDAVEDDADREVAGITTIVLHATALNVNALHPSAVPNDLQAHESLTVTPVVSRRQSEADTTPDEEHTLQGLLVEGPTATEPAVEGALVPQLVLYGVSKVAGKRPRMEIYDAHNDCIELSSKKVKRCVWASDNVPVALKGKEFTPNQALIHLRNALDASKKSLGSNGINMKVNLCTNETGPVQTLKRIIDRKELRKFIN